MPAFVSAPSNFDWSFLSALTLETGKWQKSPKIGKCWRPGDEQKQGFCFLIRKCINFRLPKAYYKNILAMLIINFQKNTVRENWVGRLWPSQKSDPVAWVRIGREFWSKMAASSKRSLYNPAPSQTPPPQIRYFMALWTISLYNSFDFKVFMSWIIRKFLAQGVLVSEPVMDFARSAATWVLLSSSFKKITIF